MHKPLVIWESVPNKRRYIKLIQQGDDVSVCIVDEDGQPIAGGLICDISDMGLTLYPLNMFLAGDMNLPIDENMIISIETETHQ